MSVRFPDVPFFDGVPAVLRGAENAASSISPIAGALTTEASDGITVVGLKGWGIYNADGSKALTPDSIYAVEPSREFRISDYPQEEGGFQSYNKVATPGEVRFTVTKGGHSRADRQAFLSEVEALIETTDLYTIVTPEASFANMNLVRRDYRRTAENGAKLLTVELLAVEIRVTAEGAFSTTKAPSGADPVNGGPVRAATPTDAQTPAVGPS